MFEDEPMEDEKDDNDDVQSRIVITSPKTTSYSKYNGHIKNSRDQDDLASDLEEVSFLIFFNYEDSFSIFNSFILCGFLSVPFCVVLQFEESMVESSMSLRPKHLLSFYIYDTDIVLGLKK